jgi:hypothetical protein
LFEVTNSNTRTIDITGWKMDDSSGSFAASVALNGITSIAPGESVIFIETDDPVGKASLFRSTWFGAYSLASLQIGSYTGGGVGLSTGGDAVNLYNATGQLQASVTFLASPAGPSYPSFDNAFAKNNTGISLLSATGANGAFVALNDSAEIGSPGTINNLAPAAAADSASVDEDGTVTIDVLGNDGDPDSDGLVISAVTPAGHGSVSVVDGKLLYVPSANFNGSDSFTYAITDLRGGSATALVSITVNAVADQPNFAVSPATGLQGASIPLAIAASLVDADGSESLAIIVSGMPAGATLSKGTNLGGGVWSLVPSQLAGLKLNGAPAGSFALTVSAVATESSNASTATRTASLPVSVSGIGLVGGVLTVYGTSDDDIVMVDKDGNKLRVYSTFVSTQTFTLSSVSRIVVLAGGGNDVVFVDDNIKVPALLDGGSGNDLINAGGGASILLGGTGNDILVGGKDRDILIGGTGIDLLTSRGDEDILIGGSTVWDADTTALLGLQAEWTRTDLKQPARVAHLRSGGGLNGSVVLSTTTVIDDDATDLLSGGSGSDWYWVDLREDIVLGKKKGETVN